MNTDYDILIAGGGPVGISLALALQGLPYRIAIAEARAAAPARAADAAPGRHLALAYSSRRILESLGAWPQAEATAIRHIHISQQGRFGAARLHGADEGLEALGYVVDSGDLDAALQAALRGTGVQVLDGAGVLEVDVQPQTVTVHTREGEVRCRLLVAADGAQSTVRDCLRIATEEHDYAHTALLAVLQVDRDAGGWAYERFTYAGPLALLPMKGGLRALIWTQSPERTATTLVLSEADFLTAAQQAFGHRAGRFLRVERRSTHPLRLLRARSLTQSRVVLAGNAAQAVHPVAAQGLNLALRDVASLAELLHAQEGADPGDVTLLQAYARWRREDVARIVGFTDFLARAFTLPGLGCPRGAGLVMIDALPFAKHRLTRLGLGLLGRPPALALGIPLAGLSP